MITLHGYKEAGKLKIGCVYPYNGLFIHVSDELKNKIIKEKDISFLPQYIPEPENRVPYYKTENILVAHPHSKGGCVMFKHSAWRDFNGYNPGFKGWGSEDDEISHRVKIMGFKTTRIMEDRAVAWHLPHHNTVRDKEPYCTLNDNLANSVISS